MPREPGLLRRNGIYYLNIRIPKRLLPLYGGREFIRKTLQTSDYKMASLRAKRARLKLQQKEEARKQREEALAALPPRERRLTEARRNEFVRRYFIELERASLANELLSGTPETQDEVAERQADIEAELDFYLRRYRSDFPTAVLDLEEFVDRVCDEKKLYVELTPEEKREFGALLAQAHVESLQRQRQRLEGRPETVHFAAFSGLTVASPVVAAVAPPAPAVAFALPPNARPNMTVAELVEEYLHEAKDGNKATLRTYQTIARIATELLGHLRLSELTIPAAKDFLRLVIQLPRNITQRYPGKTIKEVHSIMEADSEGQRLAKKTLQNYLTNISAIVNFGVRRQYLSLNPFGDPIVRAIVEKLPDENLDPVVYTIDELNQIFRAPLYTGCVDDEAGFNKPGPNRPRRGRFWMPLLALFHGFRCNEVAQLHTEDVKCEDGIWYFFIREARENQEKSTKRLKTKQSRRRVPIHPEIKKIGFMKYVEERRKDQSNPLLFTDARISKNGYYSDAISKRFRTFLNATLPKTSATFHSFRHNFRDALREAGIENQEVIEALGGWEDSRSRSAQRGYGRGLSLNLLYENISKIEYKNFAIDHLRV